MFNLQQFLDSIVDVLYGLHFRQTQLSSIANLVHLIINRLSVNVELVKYLREFRVTVGFQQFHLYTGIHPRPKVCGTSRKITQRSGLLETKSCFKLVGDATQAAEDRCDITSLYKKKN